MSTKFEYNDTGGTSNDFKAAKWYAMTFTPQAAHEITAVWIQVYRVGNGGGTLQIGIRAIDGAEKPTGADLAVGSLSCAGITTSSPGIKYEVTMGTPYALAAGTKYSMVYRTTGGDSSNFLQLRYQTTTIYPRGNMLTSNDSGSTWAVNVYDAVFEEWGNALLVPAGSGGPASLLIANGQI